jgi:hypothetical protein
VGWEDMPAVNMRVVLCGGQGRSTGLRETERLQTHPRAERRLGRLGRGDAGVGEREGMEGGLGGGRGKESTEGEGR